MMSYAFPPDLAELVDRQMKLGGYQSQDEVLRAAMRALEENKLESSAEPDPLVVAAITKSMEQLKAGLGRTFEDFDAEFRAQHGIADDA